MKPIVLAIVPVCLAASVAIPAMLAKAAPGWEAMDDWHETLERAEFERLMENLYAPDGRWRVWMSARDQGVWIRKGADPEEGDYFFPFGDRPTAVPAADATRRPDGLKGLRIALDPGHIGGAWGELEERSFAIGDGPRVQEGDLCLAAARRLKTMLEASGAIVRLVRDRAEPVTPLRPDDFREEARRRLGPAADAEAGRDLAARLFYRDAEIRARAGRVNCDLRPDLVVALHIDASAWPDPEHPALVEGNTGHVLVHGSYLPQELADDAMRRQLWRRLTEGYHRVELPLARALASAMVDATGLPPYRYRGAHAQLVDDAGYVWARNLLANRLYDCPVVYLEPWTLNSEAVYPWATLGDYEGERVVAGESRASLPAVYAAFVYEGLRRYYGDGGSD